MSPVAWIVGAVVVFVLVLGVAADLILSAGRIHPRVSVAGVPVGGLTPAGARVALDKALVARAAKPVTVVYKDQSWTITADDIGLSFDQDAQIDTAMAVGREGGPLSDFGQRVRAVFVGVDVPAAPVADKEELGDALESIASGTDVPARDAAVVIKDARPRVEDGADGRGLQREVLERRLLAAFSSPQRSKISAPVAVVRKRVDAAEAQRAAGVVKTMLAAPVSITHEERSWTFTPAEFADWIDVAPSSPKPASGQPSVPTTLTIAVSADAAREALLKRVGGDVGRPAKDAKFRTANGIVTIVPSQEGIGPDVEALAFTLTRELQNGSPTHSVELRTTRVQPKLTTAKARSMGIDERISTFTTTYEASNRPRVNNIHLLGDALDGTLIKPGGTFSFNGAAGERTAAKGYQEANAIVKGRLVPQLGGGVCQVGTTVFNAVFKSGLPVVERHNHSFYISHYPDGRDATVSWGGPDLKFKNSTDHWILVSVSYSNSSITVSLYGTDPGYEVTAEKGEWTGIRKAGTEEIKDPKLEKGSKVVEESGVAGRSIVVKRIVEKDGKVVRTDSFVSKYRPKSQIVRVGTKVVESETETKTP